MLSSLQHVHDYVWIQVDLSLSIQYAHFIPTLGTLVFNVDDTVDDHLEWLFLACIFHPRVQLICVVEKRLPGRDPLWRSSYSEITSPSTT